MKQGVDRGGFPVLHRRILPDPMLVLASASPARRRLLEQVGWLDESLHYSMDYDYWLRAGLRHPGASLPARLSDILSLPHAAYLPP